jgi:quercetin dioxygenase-like cupin family protein
MNNLTTLPNADQAEALCLGKPQVPIPVTNLFAPGIYWREIEIPADCFVVGHRHQHETINVMLTGKIRIEQDGVIKELTAPQVIVSPAGTRKMAYAVEPVRWVNIHANPTNETDQDKLAELFIN